MKAPSYIEYVTDDAICGILLKSNLKVVSVQFEVRGNRLNGLKGYRILTIENAIVAPGLGAAREGAATSQHPLTKLFE
ncbi:MAG: hypothetical protein H7039_23035 [Bryobacteraceae bacterium]|nr:hypothetical protein [Bryobacteraceae bacterium]